MPQQEDPKLVKPKFPQIIETYGASAQGDDYALLTRKTIYQPTGDAFFISRASQEEARVDIIFPGIDKKEPNADGFTISVIEKVSETYEQTEGKLLEKTINRQEPLGKIAADDFPNNTARVPSEFTTETWEYLNGIPIRHEIITRKPTISVASSYAEFKAGEGLGLIPVAKTVETWTLQSSSATGNKYLHITQNFKTRGELFPEYIAEWSNWTVGLGLALDPSSPEPEIVEIAPEPKTNDPGQPIERETEKEDIETSYPDDQPNYQPDQPLEPTGPDEPYEGPTPDDSPPDPNIDYTPDSPPWDSENFSDWDNPEEIYLDDIPENADLEAVAETAAALARARQFPYDITHPIRKVDITSYQPLRRVHVAGYVFIRDGFSIAVGEGAGGGRELVIAYTGLMIGKLNENSIATPLYKKVSTFADVVVISGQATLVDPARAVATPDSTQVLVLGVAESPVDPNYELLCLAEGTAKAVKWLGTPSQGSYRVEVAPGANLLGATAVFAIGWTQLPNTNFVGAVELTSFSYNGSIWWNNATYPWISFIVKTNSNYYKRGLRFHSGGAGFYIYGR